MIEQLNKKIILYTPSLRPGGVYESNKLLAEGFSKKNYEVVIVSNRKTDLEIKNFKHIYLNAGDLVRPFVLKRIILQEKPIAIFANMLPQNISLAIAKKFINKKTNTKYFGFVRTSTSYLDHSKIYHLPYRFLVRNLYSSLDKIVAVSKITATDVEKAFFIRKDKIDVIYDPLDINLINKLSEESLSGEDKYIFSKKTLLYAGRFSDGKGLDLLLKVFQEIRKSTNDINLVLVGDGELKEKT